MTVGSSKFIIPCDYGDPITALCIHNAANGRTPFGIPNNTLDDHCFVACGTMLGKLWWYDLQTEKRTLISSYSADAIRAVHIHHVRGAKWVRGHLTINHAQLEKVDKHKHEKEHTLRDNEYSLIPITDEKEKEQTKTISDIGNNIPKNNNSSFLIDTDKSESGEYLNIGCADSKVITYGNQNTGDQFPHVKHIRSDTANQWDVKNAQFTLVVVVGDQECHVFDLCKLQKGQIEITNTKISRRSISNTKFFIQRGTQFTVIYPGMITYVNLAKPDEQSMSPHRVIPNIPRRQIVTSICPVDAHGCLLAVVESYAKPTCPKLRVNHVNKNVQELVPLHPPQTTETSYYKLDPVNMNFIKTKLKSLTHLPSQSACILNQSAYLCIAISSFIYICPSSKKGNRIVLNLDKGMIITLNVSSDDTIVCVTDQGFVCVLVIGIDGLHLINTDRSFPSPPVLKVPEKPSRVELPFRIIPPGSSCPSVASTAFNGPSEIYQKPSGFKKSCAMEFPNTKNAGECYDTQMEKGEGSYAQSSEIRDNNNTASLNGDCLSGNIIPCHSKETPEMRIAPSKNRISTSNSDSADSVVHGVPRLPRITLNTDYSVTDSTPNSSVEIPQLRGPFPHGGDIEANVLMYGQMKTEHYHVDVGYSHLVRLDIRSATCVVASDVGLSSIILKKNT